MSAGTLTRPRHSVLVRVVLTVMLLGGAGFFMSMAVLASHDSALECQSRTACQHVERYPFGVVKTSTLSPIERADVRWSPGARSAALKLLLRHTDGTSSEYHGVGKNGERAEDTQDAINAYLAGEGGEKSFALREGSRPLGVFMAVLALTALVLISYFFSQVQVVRAPDGFELVVQRWPAPPKRRLLPAGRALRVGFEERIANEQSFFPLFVELDGGERVDLGVSTRKAELSMKEQELFTSFFRG